MSKNLTDFEAERLDFSQPLFQELGIGKRLQAAGGLGVVELALITPASFSEGAALTEVLTLPSPSPYKDFYLEDCYIAVDEVFGDGIAALIATASFTIGFFGSSANSAMLVQDVFTAPGNLGAGHAPNAPAKAGNIGLVFPAGTTLFLTLTNTGAGGFPSTFVTGSARVMVKTTALP